jgi:hypothetical protein
MKNTTVISVMVFALMMSSGGRIYADSPLVPGPEELVQAGGADIDVGTYSVPSYVDWDNDGLGDLVIGGGNGKVRIYVNVGTESNPQFSSYFFAQSNGSDLYCPPSGCLGCFPRVVYWDGDARKDLLVGQSNGTVKIFLNTSTDNDPCFDGGTLLKVGQAGSKTNIDVGLRATATVVDWNSDGRKDLVVGAYDGRIHLFINEGDDIAPDFLVEAFAQEGGFDLDVPGGRSSPHVLDLDNDGNKDLLCGNTNCQLLLYSNTGTDAAPSFSGYTAVESNGVPIDLPGSARSRQFVCDWTGDNYLDVLVGASDGKVYLYQGLVFLGDFEPDGDVDMDDLAVFVEQWLLEELSADVAPDGGDGIVNFLDWAICADGWQITVDYDDLADFADQWLKTGSSYLIADIAPAAGGDGIINVLDFAALAENWLAGM